MYIDFGKFRNKLFFIIIVYYYNKIFELINIKNKVCFGFCFWYL